MSELRYHPFLDQWVITATHRQDRTFFPPADYNPLAPTKPGGFETEIPFPEYDLVVFENKFPSLATPSPEQAVVGTPLTPVRPSEGVCEVVCYSQNPNESFATMPFSQVRKLVRVWKERTIDLSSRSEVAYVFIFENKGKEIGVTLSHPHGQIYAYPFIPPIPAKELESERRHYETTGRRLMGDVIDQVLGHERPSTSTAMVEAGMGIGTGELVSEGQPPRESTGGSTLVWRNDQFVAFVPFFARYPFEVYVAPVAPIGSLAELNEGELDGLAEALQVIAKKFDRLFGFSLPYIMAIHQKPALAGFDFAWLHVEFYPPYRTAEKLKYLAGSEAGAGAFINDTLPEVSAATLRDIEIDPISE